MNLHCYALLPCSPLISTHYDPFLPHHPIVFVGRGVLPPHSYIGSPSFLRTVARVVEKLRDHNSSVVYVCDPVLGDNGEFYNKSPNFGVEMVSLFQELILSHVTILTPNQFELEQLLGRTVTTIEEACESCDELHERFGIAHVIVTSMFLDADKTVDLLLSSRAGAKYHLKLPKIEGRFTVGEEF